MQNFIFALRSRRQLLFNRFSLWDPTLSKRSPTLLSTDRSFAHLLCQSPSPNFRHELVVLMSPCLGIEICNRRQMIGQKRRLLVASKILHQNSHARPKGQAPLSSNGNLFPPLFCQKHQFCPSLAHHLRGLFGQNSLLVRRSLTFYPHRTSCSVCSPPWTICWHCPQRRMHPHTGPCCTAALSLAMVLHLPVLDVLSKTSYSQANVWKDIIYNALPNFKQELTMAPLIFPALDAGSLSYILSYKRKKGTWP